MVYFDAETTGLSVATDSIVCAVTKKGDETIRWCETPVAKRFTPELSHRLAEYLIADIDCDLCTFNGLAFDIPILLAHMQDNDLAKRLVLHTLYNHRDIYYDFFTANGYRASLNSFLKKTDFEKPMSGEDASELVRYSNLLRCKMGRVFIKID